MPRVLAIEDDPQIRKFLTAALESNGYTVALAATGQDGIRQALDDPPDLVIVDLGLPDIGGMVVIERLRSWFTKPILVLSARHAESEKVRALDEGADDYITKPFAVGELLARLRVAMRRVGRGEETVAPRIEVGALILDQSLRRVSRDGREIHLTPIEYKLLGTLMCNRGKILTHRQLLKEVWGGDQIESLEYVRVYMRALRAKIEPTPSQPNYILTEVGVGYRFVECLAKGQDR